MNPTIKRYLVSSVTTFSAMFFTTVGIQIADGAISPEHFGWAVIGSVLAVAIRAGVKAAVESLTSVNGDKGTPTA